MDPASLTKPTPRPRGLGQADGNVVVSPGPETVINETKTLTVHNDRWFLGSVKMMIYMDRPAASLRGDQAGLPYAAPSWVSKQDTGWKC